MTRRLKLQSRIAAVVKKVAVTRKIVQSALTAQKSALSALTAQKSAARSNVAEFGEFLVNQIKDTVFRDSIFFCLYLYVCLNKSKCYGNSEDKVGVVLQGVRK